MLCSGCILLMDSLDVIVPVLDAPDSPDMPAPLTTDQSPGLDMFPVVLHS
ncbi:MAG: hypothetical protein LBV74_06595 [Tannerella sp.]|nr:hypothetical protein [Tannerella sp.]